MKTIFDILYPKLRPYMGKLLFVIFCGALISGLKGLVPQMINLLVDDAWKPGTENPEWVWQIPVGIAVLWLIVCVFRFFHFYLIKLISDYITVGLRRDLMNKYLSLNLAFLHEFRRGSGGLISRMINDVYVVQNGIYKVADIMREPFMLVFALGYLIYLDWKLTLFISILLPIVTTISKNLGRSLRKYGRQNQEVMEDLTKTLKESLDGSRIVQSFNLDDEMRRRFEEQADEYLYTRQKIIARAEASGPISEALVATAMSGILIYIGHQALGGVMTPGKFTAFLAAITFLQDATKKLQEAYITLQQTAAALDRFAEIMSSNQTQDIKSSSDEFPNSWNKIVFDDVSFSYGDKTVLKNINLTVNKGEVIALVGASGSGKSTLVNLLQRFMDPTHGKIKLDDKAINDLSLKELRDNVALVSQDVFLFSDTIERNILLGDVNKDPSKIQEAATIANAHEFISNSEGGYQTRIGHMGSGFSGGEKQRISIARAVFKDAPILVLDEATSALDSESEKEVQKGLNALMKGRTAFVIAHRLSTIKEADRILVMRDGEIIEDGTHDQLIDKKSEYFRYYSMQGH